MRILTLLGSYLKIGIANELQYRINFFVQLLQSFIGLAAGLIGLALVFSYTNELGGWSRPELLIVMGIYILMGGVINAFIQPNMGRLLYEIEQGTLDFALTKPVDGLAIASLRELNFWSLTDVLVGLGVVAVGTGQLHQQVSLWQVAVGTSQLHEQGSLWQVAAFVAALIFGSLLLYCFWVILTSIAFWVIRINEVVQVFQGIYAAGRWPVGIYPGWLRIGLTFLVPVAFAVTVPAEALAGRLTPLALLGAFGMTVLFAFLARLVWRLGVRRYSGASA